MKAEEIAKEAEIDLSLLPMQKVQVWFPLDGAGLPGPQGWFQQPGQDGPVCLPPSVWTVGQSPPDNKEFVILGMFSDSDEIRVYAAPRAIGKSPRRYVLSKHAPLIGVEHMTVDVLRSEVEEELQSVMGEDEAETIVQAILDLLQEKGFVEAYSLVKAEFAEDESEPVNGALTAPTEPAPASPPAPVF